MNKLFRTMHTNKVAEAILALSPQIINTPDLVATFPELMSRYADPVGSMNNILVTLTEKGADIKLVKAGTRGRHAVWNIHPHRESTSQPLPLETPLTEKAVAERLAELTAAVIYLTEKVDTLCAVSAKGK